MSNVEVGAGCRQTDKPGSATSAVPGRQAGMAGLDREPLFVHAVATMATAIERAVESGKLERTPHRWDLPYLFSIRFDNLRAVGDVVARSMAYIEAA